MEENYAKLISDLVKSFESSMPESEKDMAKDFEKYLNMKLNILEKSELTKNKDPKTIEKTLVYVAEKISQMSLEDVKREIVIDESLIKIKKSSAKLFELAKNVQRGEKITINSKDLENYVVILNEELKNVKQFNKKQAGNLVSEGILDYQFIKNPQTSITSIRLGK